MSDPDFILTGDGSGINERGGWATILFHPATGTTEIFAGSVSHSTNNSMELTAYMRTLEELVRRNIHELSPKILICTDSKFVVQCGRGEWERKAESLDHLWLAFDSLVEKFDGNVFFSHIPRDSGEEIIEADRIAGELRIYLEDYLEEYDSSVCLSELPRMS